ncbi:MAG: hypothetical protein IJW76_01490 [Clostridia bacterium]|nr:hypothetical protein [Clostridia bacterium]
MEIMNDAKKSYILYFWMFLCFFITDSPFANYAANGYVFKVTAPMILGILYPAYCMIFKKYTLSRSYTLVTLFIFSMVALSSALGGGGLRMTVAYLGMWLFGLFFSKTYSFEDFRRAFMNSVIFIAIFSIIIYLVLLLFPVSKYMFPTVLYSNGMTVDLFFTTFRLMSGPVRRNYGMFWEPGTYQAYLNLALLFLFKEKKCDFFLPKVIVLVLAIITTFSTTGFIVMALILCYSMLTKSDALQKSAFKKISFVVFMIGVSIIALANADMIARLVFDKMEAGNNSYDSRMLSILGNLIVTLKYPFLGAGYGNSAQVLNQLVESTSGFIHQTNTFTNYFATFGIFIGGLFIFFWMKISSALSKNLMENIFTIVILTLITSGENFLSSFAFILFLIYGFRLSKLDNWFKL